MSGLMMNREEKLKQLKTKTIKDIQIFANGERFNEIIEATVDGFKGVIKNGIEINDLDVLVDRLEEIQGLNDSVAELRDAIKDFPALPEEVKIASIEELLEAIAKIEIKPPVVNVPAQKEIPPPPNYTGAVKRMSDALMQMAISIKANAPKPASQKAADYIPYRRVIKKGNSFIFDDVPTPPPGAGGGGGGGRATNAIRFVIIDQSAPGTDTLVAAIANTTIKVVSYVVVLGGAGTTQFKSNTTAISGAMSFAANGGVSSIGSNDLPVFTTGSGEALNLTSTGSAAKGHLSYYLE